MKNYKINRKKCFILCLLIGVFLFIWIRKKVELQFKSDAVDTTKLFNFADKNGNVKHLYMQVDWCGGVSNMLFRSASLYGIGKQTNRHPCLQGKCSSSYKKELVSTFPNLIDYPMKLKCWDAPATSIPFNNKNPPSKEVMEKLETFKDAPVVNLKANYLQQIAFFEDYRPQIRELFKFNSTISDSVDKYAQKLFGSSYPHTDIKVCAHMRRNDFITDKNHPLIASQLDFTVPALDFVVKMAKNEENGSNVSVVLFSDDMEFVRKVEKEFRKANKETPTYMPDKLKRLEYMNLASRYCKYYIMTASGSTYGWWTAFLLADDLQNNVFYNARIFRPHRKDFADQFVESHFFPAKWRRLALDKETKQVNEQDRTKIPLVSI